MVLFESLGAFLPRDAYAYRGLRRRKMSVCLPDRLSHAGIECKWLHNNILKFFLPSGSPTILVFPHQTGWQYSDGDPLTAASNARGMKKNHDFRPISSFISQMMQDRAIVTMEGKWETTAKLSNGTCLNDLE